MNHYIYRVNIVRVVDGDTVDCDIDLGFGVWLKNQRVRLFGIDAPETRTRDLAEKQAGLEAKRWLQDALETGDVFIQSDEFEPRGKFGRILATFFVGRIDGVHIDVNATMVKEGLASPYFGGAR